MWLYPSLSVAAGKLICVAVGLPAEPPFSLYSPGHGLLMPFHVVAQIIAPALRIRRHRPRQRAYVHFCSHRQVLDRATGRIVFEASDPIELNIRYRRSIAGAMSRCKIHAISICISQ
jgi:hypothetical protein